MPESNINNNNNNTKEHANLFSLAVKGGFWVFLFKIAVEFFSFIRYILVVNKIPFEDFGLFGIALLIMSCINTFTQPGLNAALVHKRGDIKEDLNTAWTVGLIRSFILFLIVYLAAPFLAGLNISQEKIPLAVSIIRVMSFSFLINAFTNPGTLYFYKEMEFHKRFVLDIAGSLLGIIFSVVVVIIYKTVWSVVLGRLISNVTKCCLSYAMHQHRPALKIEIRRLKDMWSFGKWMTMSTILNFINVQGDDFFVWWYLDAAMLGIYRLAYRFGTMPIRQITHVLSQVSFPAFSKLQTDIPRMRDAYFKMIKVSSSLSIPIAGMIFILAPEFVTLFIRKAESEVSILIPAIQALAIYGMIGSLGSTTGSILQGIGRPSVITKVLLIKLCVLFSAIYPLTRAYGVAGASVSVLIASICVQPFAYYAVLKALDCRVWELISSVIAPFSSTAIMIASVWLTKTAIDDVSIWGFMLLAIIAISAYLISMLILDVVFGFGYRVIFIEQLKVFKSKEILEK